MAAIAKGALKFLAAFAMGFGLASPALGQHVEVAAARTAPQFVSSVVRLQNGTQIETHIHRGKSRAPTFVLLNGLVYSTNRWANVSAQLAMSGATVINFAFSPQPENLRLLQQNETPKFLARGIELKDLASEVNEVLNILGVNEKVHVVGLSYGASVASEFSLRYASRVEATIFVSPLIIPLDYYDNGGRNLRAWLNTVRFWENTPCDIYGSINPWLCQATDYWYDSYFNYFYEQYLAKRVKDVPQGIAPELYKKSIFHLVRASRDFDLRTIAPRLKNVHMFVASEDDAPLLADQDRAWSEVPAAQQRSFVVFRGAQHALPDEAPGRLTDLLTLVARKDASVTQGARIQVPADY